MTAVIVEDEIPAGIRLERLLIQYEFQVLVVLNSVKKATAWLKENKHPDIIFMDIKLRDGNCFEIFDKVKIESKIVFTTAFDEYALNAFNYNSIDYLLKPIDEEEIAIALDKFKIKEIAITTEQVQNLHLFTNGKLQDTIALSTQEGLLFVKIDNIMYLEASSNYTMIVMQDKSKHLASKTLATFEDVLQDNTLFFRSHKSHIVNLKFIKQYIRGDGGELIMLDGKNIPLSRTKKQDFLDLFTRV